MTEFSTAALLEAEVSSASLRAARDDIESELENALTVDVNASAQLANDGGGERASRERAMSRQLLDSQTESLSEIQEDLEEPPVLDEWEIEHDLSRTRNDLLRNMNDSIEKGNLSSRGGGGGSLLGSIGGVLSVSSLLGSVSIGVGSLIASRASLEASDLIKDAVSIGEGAVIEEGADISAAALVASGATIAASALIENPLGLQVSDLIEDAVELVPSDLISEKADPRGGSGPTSDGSGAIDPSTIAGGAALGAGGGIAAWLARQGGASSLIGGAGAGGAAGVGMPILTPEMLPEGSALRTNPRTGESAPPSILTEQGRKERLGPIVDFITGIAGGGSDGKGSTSGSQGSTSSNQARDRKRARQEITYSPTFKLDTTELERRQRQELRKLERRIQELENGLTGGSGGLPGR
ncbi:hypothetical protein [Halorussus marinus]|uniref:hypothetical protein n=1 Tax=Halorussus marinus TaxID=2505976 RepID=UPI0010931BC2|nr:hypothetical protein [Halorussus marinus]